MALRVWLPLTGSLENKGISNYTPTIASGNSWASTGKIGAGAITLTKQQTILPTSSCMSGAKQMSYCYWVKVNTAWETQWLDGIRWISTDGSATHTSRQEFYTNCTLIGTWYSGGSISGKSFTPGVWTHLAATFDYNTGKVVFYINGTQVGTTSNLSTTHYCRGDFYIGDSGVNIDENDVRIYDHCLSAAEVKEISQGLVLHYKLDGFNNASMLPPQYQQLEYIESSGTSYFNTGYKFNIETDECKVIFKGNDTSNNGMIFASSGGKYFWFYYYGSSGIRIYADNGSGQQGIAGISSDLNQHTMEFKNKTYYIDGNNKGSLTNSYTDTTNNIWLFSYGNSSYPFKGRIYYTEIKKNGQYQRIFIPAKRLTDSVAGMYDLITNTFYVSSNAAFTAGTAVGTLAIQDSSGYEYNGTIVGFPTLSSNSARYSTSTYLADGTVSRIVTPSLSFEPHAVTLSIWFKSTNKTPTGDYHMIVDSNANRQWYEMCINKGGYFRGGLFVNGARKADNGTSTSCLNGNWHMLTLTYDGTNVNRYVDGVMEKATAAAYSSGLSTPTALTIGRDGPNASYAVKEASISDFRIYATALSAADVLSLYNTAAKVDNLHNIHTFEYIENNNSTKLTKQGQFKTQNIQENISVSLPYDKTLYTEPDGSTWIHVFHHNNPAGTRFSGSADDWTNGKYIDADKWYWVEQFLNYTPRYEFMVKQKTTSDATETKFRWIQTPNPLTATWTDVKPGTVTFITTSGYSNNSMGGMYLMKSSNLHMCIANGSNGNWFGGIGASTAYQGGIPGYPNTTVTSGYIDLYLRIYPNAKIIKELGIGANNLIEK